MRNKYLGILLCSLVVCSCNGQISLKYVPFTSYVDEQNTRYDSDDEFFYSKKDNAEVNYIGGSITNYRDLFNNKKNNRTRMNMISTGERHLLVLPVYFTDSDVSTHDRKTILIQNAFFGESSHTNYESVASYYNKSSYGKLKLTGEVAPWYNIGISSNDWKSLSSSYMTASNIITEKAVDYLKENNLININDYDLDQDGYIDGIYVIYDHPLESNSGNNLFWAYSYSIKEGENGYNLSEPYANMYSWSSISCIDQNNNYAYTNYLLHETGHIFGLDDYYNTLYLPNSEGIASDYHYQPTGCFDMMDYNVGDHSAFSKYLLSWVSPRVIKDNVNTTVKLSPFVDSGECILVPTSKYNNTPYSEYLLIEYFAPNGLNNYDASFSYTDKNGNKGVYTFPQYHGLKIYHVNATLGYFPRGGNSAMICSIDDPDAASKISGKNVAVSFAYSNTITDDNASKGSPVLYHLLESSGDNTFINGIPANNKTLFRLGDDFGITVFKDFVFDNGESLKYTFEVTAVDSESISIKIRTK